MHNGHVMQAYFYFVFGKITAKSKIASGDKDRGKIMQHQIADGRMVVFGHFQTWAYYVNNRS